MTLSSSRATDDETQTEERRPDSAPPASTTAVPGPPPKPPGKAFRATSVLSTISVSGSSTPSEEDYGQIHPQRNAGGGLRYRVTHHAFEEQRPGIVENDSGVHITSENVKGNQEFFDKGTQRAVKSPTSPSHTPGEPRDFALTHQFSAFDRKNTVSTNSPFRGFYMLLWISVALFVLKISAENWRAYGNPLGTNEIMKTMFRRDVLVLLLSDGVMCGLTGVTWVFQILILHGFVRWNKSGWILQNVWQTAFVAGVVGWTMVRDWPWTHTVFFVLHGIVMVMKQHSYAFYNGNLSTVLTRRQFIESKLRELESVHSIDGISSTAPAASSLSTSHLKAVPSAKKRSSSFSRSFDTTKSDIDKIARAISSREPLDDEEIHFFGRILKCEIDDLTDELRGIASEPSKAYPANLGFIDHYMWIPLPTVVYELQYPRSDTISWSYVAEKVVAMVGVIFVMIQVSQYAIYPVVIKTIKMKERGDTLSERFNEFPWLLSDLVFPFMMEYLLVWYLIWEIILNILAELTFFADRRFYGAWWNSVSWDQFARDWNRPVHIFLLRHVYHSSISSMKVNKHTATLLTFFLSACVHELVMWCLFKKLRGYLLILQMFQLPLVKISRTKWLKGRETLGNLIFWLGICTGPSFLCSLYLIL